MKKKQIENTSCICKICNKIIFTNVENYCHLEDFRKGKFYMDGYYHTKCFNDKIKGSAELNSMKKQTMALLKKAGELIGMQDKDKEEVVYIN